MTHFPDNAALVKRLRVAALVARNNISFSCEATINEAADALEAAAPAAPMGDAELQETIANMLPLDICINGRPLGRRTAAAELIAAMSCALPPAQDGRDAIVKAAVHWYDIHGPATPMTSSAMTDVATACEAYRALKTNHTNTGEG